MGFSRIGCLPASFHQLCVGFPLTSFPSRCSKTNSTRTFSLGPTGLKGCLQASFHQLCVGFPCSWPPKLICSNIDILDSVRYFRIQLHQSIPLIAPQSSPSEMINLSFPNRLISAFNCTVPWLLQFARQVDILLLSKYLVVKR